MESCRAIALLAIALTLAACGHRDAISVRDALDVANEDAGMTDGETSGARLNDVGNAIAAAGDDARASDDDTSSDGSAGDRDALSASDGGTCPEDMVPLPGFCIDRFEAPNTPGAEPLAMQTAPDGEAWCEARAKR